MITVANPKTVYCYHGFCAGIRKATEMDLDNSITEMNELIDRFRAINQL